MKMRVNEIFEGIQGEGRYAGYPALFVRLSGCTRECDFCDTKYHKEGKEMSIKQVRNRILKSNLDIVVFTGGEPIIQLDEIYKVCHQLHKDVHIETNGDFLPPDVDLLDYICFSPKDMKSMLNVDSFVTCMGWSEGDEYDIKVVTDLEVNKELIPYATMLMPLTVPNHSDRTKYIRQRVWEYCIKHKIRYSPRLHVEIWGNRRSK